MAAFDFKRDVVDVSFQKPVLIDFWADWCGPCKILGPVLEDLEREDKGKWALVKIDTEAYPDIASYFRIQSIPNCKLVHEGKIVDEFAGALTRAQVRQWLDKHLSSLVVEEAEQIPDDFDVILQTQDQIPDKEFMGRVEDFVKSQPDHETAVLTLARHMVFFKPQQAIQLIERLGDHKGAQDLLPNLKSIGELIEMDLEHEDATSSALSQARTALLEKDGQAAIDLIIEVLHKNRNYGDDIARRAGIALFNIWGPQHPLTKENRKLFDMAIW
ncbi:MAG TPA: tetratricopeptide repeat protein [Saprospiraceae bacterium]|nr:tetratricopeptide repeat protein [Saprospiraceae bacterium]HMX87326.1 tetratricopeptide repeat protein [Saprospiraceae bacterium]HMZ39153.1 tetratricopeptide repeat protein [Saprospiraceae bacterium]HNA63814.1 tetratricopeptide repeat protein [Saprospiraceae bacterium]HNB29849.1 tetratricopeptide repeat protein [Saprospiraceae bacterium]